MIGLDKRVGAKQYVVPNNSAMTLQQKPVGIDFVANMTENKCDESKTNRCKHCENMAKNFLYLESLIRNNLDKKQECTLCNSSLKFLQYVNRNIMSVFGNFDTIVQAAKAFATQAPILPKYSVRPPQPKPTPTRAKGGATNSEQKAKKSNKPKTNKSKKSVKASKSGKSLRKSKSKSGTKKRSSGGGITPGSKMMLKNKYRSKTAQLSKQLSKVVRSASQYQNLRAMRSKLANKAKKQKKQVNKTSPSIPWGLLKKNMPKRKTTATN
ncbi:uncharacterized protein LOC115621423 [Scaptodrosophila lebanonensis]|uniref:Uncharacterized protein LOC115621423 n=1 Tax=Drosophila lebanonensis TaxID=7225 RepID=A0A6J2T6N4_DROLE|nr:uncharacterized protein LOC115621423 [Scaptodrosophila lebanonensis]